MRLRQTALIPFFLALAGLAQATTILPNGPPVCTNTTASGTVSVSGCASDYLAPVGGIQGIKFSFNVNPSFGDRSQFFSGNSLDLVFENVGQVVGDTGITAGTAMTVYYDFHFNSSGLSAALDSMFEFSITDGGTAYDVVVPIHGSSNTGWAAANFLRDVNLNDVISVQTELKINVSASTGILLTVPQTSFDFNSPTPEPATWALFGAGLAAIAARSSFK